MKIYKYQIPKPNDDGISYIEMPTCSEPLSVGLQGDNMVLWAMVWSEHYKENKVFIVVTTGVEYPYSGKFIGTITSSSGVVWHVLEHK